MNLNCRFSACHWCGSGEEIFEHFECDHKKFLREPKGNLYFDLSLDDLQQEALILCSPNGLYWFRRKLQPSRNDGMDYGVFHIGESEQVEYELKVGLKRDGYCEYLGSYTTQQDNNHNLNKEEEYHFKFDFEYLTMLNETVPSRRLRLYFGEYDDSDDEIWPGPEDIEWLEEDERLNRLIVERFTCAVCLEYIRRDARFCEKHHFICLHCFEKMWQVGNCKCPICRGQYLYDCTDQNIERLLHMVKWPDVPECNVDAELLERAKSLPHVKFVKVKPGED